MLKSLRLLIAILVALELSGCATQFAKTDAQCCQVTASNGSKYTGFGATKTKALHAALSDCGSACKEEYILQFK